MRDIQPWQWALILKWPLFAIGGVVYFYTVVKFVQWLKRRHPNNRFIQFLVKERGELDPDVIARREAARRRFEAEQSERQRLDPPSSKR